METTTKWMSWFGIVGLVAAAAAQADPQRTRLMRAVVIEEEERDLARAVEAYREVARGATDAEVRGDAELRLATALCAIGKKEEAQPLLDALVKIGGARGQKAGEVLAATNDQERWLWARTQAALSGPRSLQELIFLGRGAVPHVLRHLWLGDPMSRDLLTVGVGLMCAVGGAESVDGLRPLVQHKDIVVRRTCASVFASRNREKVAEEVVPVFALLLADPSPEVRREVLGGALRFSWPQIRRVLDDSDAGVRDAAFAALGEFPGCLPRGPQRAELVAAIARELARAAPSLDLWRSAPKFELYQNATERSLWLRMLARAEANAASFHTGMQVDEFPLNAHADEVVAAAEAIAQRGSTQPAHLLDFVKNASRTWNRAVLPQALRLARLKCFPQIENWLQRQATPDDAAAIIEHFDVVDARREPWQSQWPVPATAWRRLAYFVEHTQGEAAGTYLSLLVKSRADEAMAWLLEFTTTEDRFCKVVQALCNAEEPTLATQNLMLALLDVLPIGKDGNTAAYRTHLFEAAARLGRDDAVPRLAAAYVAGVRNEGRGLAVYRASDATSRRMPAFDPTHVARVVDACLATGSPLAFADAVRLVGERDLPAPVYAALCRHALSAPEAAKFTERLLSWKHIEPAAARQLTLDALRSKDSAVVDEAIKRVEPGLGADAVALLADNARAGNARAVSALGDAGDPGQAGLLRALFQHEQATVRQSAMRALHRLQGADAIDALLPLAEDPNSSVRHTFTEIAAKLLDRRSVPALLRLLRDESTQNREDAQKALAAIDFYHTQTARWQRVLADSSLDAPSAAEALVKQAKAGNDKAVRLAAIASLGTLKVPETLPVLISLMQDPDPEVAAAARAAVAKING